MEINEIIKLLFERADATQVFWNFYIVIATAILGFLAVIKVSRKAYPISIVLTIAFSIFAFSNCDGLDYTRLQRVALAEYATFVNDIENKGSVQVKAVIKSGTPKSANLLLFFHLIADAIIIALIWVIPLFKSRVLHELSKSNGKTP